MRLAFPVELAAWLFIGADGAITTTTGITTTTITTTATIGIITTVAIWLTRLGT